MKKFIKSLSKYEEGQGLVEYALILALVALAVILVVTQLGDAVKDKFNSIKNEVTAAGVATEPTSTPTN